jgi:hypothetical protein
MAGHGGARPGAGRKPKEVKDSLPGLLQEGWPREDRLACIQALAGKASGGDVKAAALLLGYSYGKPKEPIEVSGGDTPLRHEITIVYQDTAAESESASAEPDGE